MLLAAIRKKFSSRNCRLGKSFSTVIMLTTNLCRFSIFFLHDRQQNGNVKRSELVEFDGRKSNKCSRYHGIFCRSSVILISLSPHALSIFRSFQRLFCKECKFLPDHEYSSPQKTAWSSKLKANVNLCLFCRFKQHYKVH